MVERDRLPAGDTLLAVESVRSNLEADDDFVVLEIDGRTIWPRDRWQDAGFAFYIGRKGSPLWDANAWVEVPLPDLAVHVPREKALELIQEALAKGLEQARARL